MHLFRSKGELDSASEKATQFFCDLYSKQQSIKSFLNERISIEKSYSKSLENLAGEVKKLFGSHQMWGNGLKQFFSSVELKRNQSLKLAKDIDDLVQSEQMAELMRQIPSGVTEMLNNFSLSKKEINSMRRQFTLLEDEVQSYKESISRLRTPETVAIETEKLSKKSAELNSFVNQAMKKHALVKEKISHAKTTLPLREQRLYEATEEVLYAVLVLEFGALRSQEYDLSKVIESMRKESKCPNLQSPSLLEGLDISEESFIIELEQWEIILSRN